VTSGKTIEIRDLATLERVGEPIACASEVTNIAWSPDGGHLAFTTKGGRVVVRDERGHVVLESKKGTPQYAVAFSPDGKRLAFGGHDRQVREADLATKKETVISHGQPYWITCLGYSPDGERIAVGDESCDIWLYQISTRKRLFTTSTTWSAGSPASAGRRTTRRSSSVADRTATPVVRRSTCR
jgi:WD40 repeat protein